MRVDTTGRVPIKMWLDEIEEGALEQARNLSNLPFAYKHIALMPDCHKGEGMPIGGVLAADRVIVPGAVGVDIGCGMGAVRTTLIAADVRREDLVKAHEGIKSVVPTGFNHHSEPQVWSGFAEAPDLPVINRELESARHQLGTMGGNNHFMELQKGSDGYVWVMIHSGSRNFGFKIAKEYEERAKYLCKRWHSNIPDMDLAFLPIEERDAKEYIAAMNYALMFAEANRALMMERIKAVFVDVFSGVGFSEGINIHHNYAAWERHAGKDVLVHRKGATSAREGQLGIIPGDQGSKSYIVRGLGCRESFMSCSHGAGRRMGRRQARRDLSLEDEMRRMDSKGIIHSIKTTADLEEAPGSYKNIDDVMRNQADLVTVVVTLEPLAVIKARADEQDRRER